MKATQEMSELRAAIEAAGASPALTHCTVLAGELATRIAQMEDALQSIYDYDDGAWAAGKHYKDAVKQGMKSMRAIAVDGLRVPQYPQPRSFGRSNSVVSHTGALPDSKISNQAPSPGVGL